jgi:membrane protease YdiL (CAAX protease family)
VEDSTVLSLDQNAPLDPNAPVDTESSPPPPPSLVTRRGWRWTILSLVESGFVSGIPTQVVVTVVLMLGFGLYPYETGDRLSLEFFAMLSFIDTALVALLILLFLTLNGEHSRDVFIGPRSVPREIVRGLLLVPAAFVGVTLIVLTVRAIAPSLQTVPDNPLTQFMRSPLEAGIFVVVVVLAGGVREELQRTFVLSRFRHMRRGLPVVLVGYSVLFGLLHYDQGWDAAIGVGLLGLFWGVLYLKRRSAIMSMTNHAAFNAVQVIAQALAHSFGM